MVAESTERADPSRDRRFLRVGERENRQESVVTPLTVPEKNGKPVGVQRRRAFLVDLDHHVHTTGVGTVRKKLRSTRTCWRDVKLDLRRQTFVAANTEQLEHGDPREVKDLVERVGRATADIRPASCLSTAHDHVHHRARQQQQDKGRDESCDERVVEPEGPIQTASRTARAPTRARSRVQGGLDVLSESDSAVIVGKMYREWLSGPDSFAFLAKEDGRLVGYVVGFYDEPHFMWSTGRVGHIDSFYVLPELRGRGIGCLLMEAAYTEMRQAGATTVALEMVATNDVARRFYEQEGFTTTFVQMHRRLGPA